MLGSESENTAEGFRGASHAIRPEDLGIGKLFDRVRDAVIVADAKTERIVLWNPAAATVFGYSIPEALELRVEDLQTISKGIDDADADTTAGCRPS